MKIFDKVIDLVNAGDIRRGKFALWFNKLLYRLQHKLVKYPVKLWYMPLNMQVEVTSKCNFNCPNCGISNIPDSIRKDLSLETFQKIVPFFRYMDLVRLFCYGEPLMNPNFLRMIEIAKENGVTVAFHTNGMLLSAELSREIIKLKTDLVIFSVDGATEETYKKIRPQGDFKKVISILTKLNILKQQYKCEYPRLSICYTIMKDNLEEMPLMVELANKLGIKSIHFQNILSFNETANQQSLFKLDPGYVEKIYEKTCEKARFYQIKLRMPKIRLDYRGKIICNYPWKDLQIRSDGLVFVCNCFCYPMYIYHHVENGILINEKRFFKLEILGDINKESLTQIWNNKKYQFLRRQFKLKQAKSPCNSCLFPYGIH